MFNRNDKTPEPNAGGKTPAANKQETPMTVTTPTPPIPPAEPKRTAPLQPLVGAAAPPGPSLISKALKITGQLESSEDIQIEGEVDGDVRAVVVRVGANAKIKGTVYGEEVELAGSVEGKIEARKVVLTSSAHMAGDVVHQDITIHSGAYIFGHCRPEYGKTESNVQPLHKAKTQD